MTPLSTKKLKKNLIHNCKRRGLVHVYRFLRHVGEQNQTVHPKHPDRFPKTGVFRCTECGDEAIFNIRHRT